MIRPEPRRKIFIFFMISFIETYQRKTSVTPRYTLVIASLRQRWQTVFSGRMVRITNHATGDCNHGYQG